jgi:DNA-binding transcriptional LysR family regulator
LGHIDMQSGMSDPPVEIRDFRYFLAVAEELHFRRAAERLKIAQPHLSLHIRLLEERVGAPLLERTTRSVKLTPAGEDFLQRARYVLTQVSDAVAGARRLAAGHTGKLNIAFTPAAGFGLLPAVLSTFRRDHPNVEIALSYRQTASQVADLIEGKLHFGFLRLPIHSRRLKTITLAREGVVAVLPRQHKSAKRGSVALEDLADESFIQYTPILGAGFQEHITSYCSRAGFSPRVAQESSDTYAIICLVAAGYGIAILPEWVRNVPNRNVIYRNVSEIPKIVELAGCWLEAEASPALTAFMETIKRRLDQHPIDERI